MGMSPRLTEGEGRGLPPLDLGGPALPAGPERDRDRLHRRVKGARGVEFSPRVESIPDEPEDHGEDGDADSEGDGEDLSGDTAAESIDIPKGSVDDEDKPGRSRSGTVKSGKSADGAELPSIGITPLSPPKPRLHKRTSPSIGGGTPKMFGLSPRAQPSVGVSTSNTADAPSGKRSIRELKTGIPLIAGSFGLPSPTLQPRTARTFEELYDSLQPDEQKFFDILDEQLDKVETFYTDREEEAMKTYRNLRMQLQELATHRRIFHEQYPAGVPEWEAKMSRVLPGAKPNVPMFSAAARKLHMRNTFTAPDSDTNAETPKAEDSGLAPPSGETSRSGNRSPAPPPPMDPERQYSPERYQKYKKDLRNATLEFYRHLELIKNYRVSIASCTMLIL